MVHHRPQNLRALILTIVLAACALSAQAVGYSNRFRSPRNPERPIRKSTRLVVLHTTEAHARSSLNKLCERGEAHYCVVENGLIYRIVDREREAFHAGRSMWNGVENCDSYAIGIEVVGHHDQPITLQQIEALRELVGNLKKIYNLSDNQVVCHSHVAYGAPNRWQKRNHRGRKRCGMLFAMSSIRRQLNLRSKPAYDPDVRAGRLIQADSYLAQVLYGNVDTMAGRYSTSAVNKPATSGGGLFSGLRNLFSRKTAPATPAPASKSRTAPKVQKSQPSDSKPQTATSPKTAVSPVPGFTKGKFVAGPAATSSIRQPALGDPARDLKILRALPGYVQGGPTSATRTPFAIAGKQWNAPTTYYFNKGVITRGDRVDARKIEPGTLIFYRKP